MLGFRLNRSGRTASSPIAEDVFFLVWTISDRPWDDEAETSNALEVCRKLDEFARLIPYLPKQTALGIWGVPFAKAWLVLERIVNDERKKCRWPNKWNAFARLGHLAL